MKADKTYHHGNLQETLLHEAHQLLSEGGVEALSLRKLAERAGVSRTAPYHHFKDKHALLCALAADGYRQLDTMLGTLPEKAEMNEVLSGFVRDYLRFAREQPQRYELMFGRRLWKLAQPTPELKRVAYGTFRNYAQAIAALCPHLSSRSALRLAQASWATLHGLCHLMIDGIYIDPVDMEDVSQVALDMLIKGMNRTD